MRGRGDADISAKILNYASIDDRVVLFRWIKKRKRKEKTGMKGFFFFFFNLRDRLLFYSIYEEKGGGMKIGGFFEISMIHAIRNCIRSVRCRTRDKRV